MHLQKVNSLFAELKWLYISYIISRSAGLSTRKLQPINTAEHESQATLNTDPCNDRCMTTSGSKSACIYWSDCNRLRKARWVRRCYRKHYYVKSLDVHISTHVASLFTQVPKSRQCAMHNSRNDLQAQPNWIFCSLDLSKARLSSRWYSPKSKYANSGDSGYSGYSGYATTSHHDLQDRHYTTRDA